MLLAGCATIPNLPQRGLDNTIDLPIPIPEEFSVIDSARREAIRRHDLERFGDVTLGVIEFDDQGWYWRQEQAERVLGYVKQAAESDATIVVYVHGWQHNADTMDPNLVAFRRVLSLLARRGNGGKGQPVFGLYVGWRGQVLTPPLSFLTFWNRGGAAARIAHGAAIDLFAKIRTIYLDARAKGHDPHLITVGHSFGALIVYESVSGFLLTNIMEHSTLGYSLEHLVSPVTGYGDLVVLVNPAFEAAIYERFAAMRYDYYYFDRAQKPLMLVVSSVGDTATHRWFPIGRRVAVASQAARSREERAAMTTALGNFEPYVTHLLRRCDDEGIVKAAKAWGGRPSPCFGGARLVEHDWHTVAAERSPFIVATTTNDIIEGHGGIFGAPFINFLVDYILANTRSSAAN